MQAEWLLASAVLTVILGLIHSVLGERLVFSALRQGGIRPQRAPAPLQRRHVRILWATWHLVSLFGLALAWTLWCLAWLPAESQARTILIGILAAMLSGSALVAYATDGRHPGWIVLLLISLGLLVAIA